jgi:hypothetical protein
MSGGVRLRYVAMATGRRVRIQQYRHSPSCRASVGVQQRKSELFADSHCPFRHEPASPASLWLLDSKMARVWPVSAQCLSLPRGVALALTTPNFDMGVSLNIAVWLPPRHTRRQASFARLRTAGCSLRVGFAVALDRIPKDAWVGAALQTCLCTTLDCFAISDGGGPFLTWCSQHLRRVAQHRVPMMLRCETSPNRRLSLRSTEARTGSLILALPNCLARVPAALLYHQMGPGHSRCTGLASCGLGVRGWMLAVDDVARLAEATERDPLGAPLPEPKQAFRRCAWQALRAEDGLCYPGAGRTVALTWRTAHRCTARVQPCRYTYSAEPCQVQGTDDY